MKITLTENAAQIWLSLIPEDTEIQSIELVDGIVTMEVDNFPIANFYNTLYQMFDEQVDRIFKELSEEEDNG
jgi:hypothetical protein